MNEFDYEKIQGLVKYYLWKTYHERHLEDCVQFCSLAWLEGRTNIQWSVIDYCRINGIGERGKVAAKPLENATFVGLSTDESEDGKENGFLFDKYDLDNHDTDIDNDCRLSLMGRLEEFLLPVNLKRDTLKWVLKNYRPRMIKEKIYNT